MKTGDCSNTLRTGREKYLANCSVWRVADITITWKMPRGTEQGYTTTATHAQCGCTASCSQHCQVSAQAAALCKVFANLHISGVSSQQFTHNQEAKIWFTITFMHLQSMEDIMSSCYHISQHHFHKSGTSGITAIDINTRSTRGLCWLHPIPHPR